MNQEQLIKNVPLTIQLTHLLLNFNFTVYRFMQMGFLSLAWTVQSKH